MRCPKCGLEQPPAPECAGCGVVFAKLRAAAPGGGVEEQEDALREATSAAPVTKALIAANVALYLAMLAGGVHAMQPTGQSLIAWGANYGPRTTGGEWWRLASCMFVHIGAFHLAFNMAVLWGIGGFIERLAGSAGMLVVYLVSGLLASAASIAWNPFIVSAGASGAVFGLYGVLLGYLARQPAAIRPEAVAPLRKSALMFVAFNVLYGVSRQGIDMAAHLGGLAAGFACGLVMAKAAATTWRNLELLAGGLLALWGAAQLLPRAIDVQAELAASAPVRTAAVEAYDGALRRWRSGESTAQDLAGALETRVLPEWRQQRQRLEALHARLPPAEQDRLDALLSYVAARQKGWESLADALRRDDPEAVEQALAQHEIAEFMLRMQQGRRR